MSYKLAYHSSSAVFRSTAEAIKLATACAISLVKHTFRPLKPVDVIICQLTGSSLVSLTACRLLSSIPLWGLRMNNCQVNFWTKFEGICVKIQSCKKMHLKISSTNDDKLFDFNMLICTMKIVRVKKITVLSELCNSLGLRLFDLSWSD